jgi:hypothetical protein
MLLLDAERNYIFVSVTAAALSNILWDPSAFECARRDIDGACWKLLAEQVPEIAVQRHQIQTIVQFAYAPYFDAYVSDIDA